MTLKRFALCHLVLLGLWVAGCTSLPPEATGDDASLTASVQSRLGEDVITSRLNLGVSVDQGVATVSGSARDPGAKARALAIIRGTPGIKGLVDSTTR